MSATEYVAMPSGLILPAAHAQRELRKSKRPVAVDLFCGCGGFSLGLKQAGWHVIAAVDHWPIALITYATNLCRWGEMQWHFIGPEDAEALEKEMAAVFKRAGVPVRDGEPVADGKIGAKVPLAGDGWIKGQPRDVPGTRHLILGDIAKLSGDRLLQMIGMEPGELDAIVGGPPCQGFSAAGKKDPHDPRNGLIFDFARLIVECRPKTMVMENVPNIASMVTPEGIPVLDVFCRILEEGDYAGVDMVRRSLAAQGIVIAGGRFSRARGKRNDREKPGPQQGANKARTVAPDKGELPLFAKLAADD